MSVNNKVGRKAKASMLEIKKTVESKIDETTADHMEDIKSLGKNILGIT